MSLSWLISALNIINEAEINYKQARNKRLHVELALIKLTYLHQALELSAGDNGPKKKIEAVKAVSFRAIPIIEVKENKDAGRQRRGKTKTQGRPETQGNTNGARLDIETPRHPPIRQSAKPPIRRSNPQLAEIANPQ